MMQKSMQSIKRRAFTMIELVMVIVILGIVSMIATDVIANMYKSYIQTKIVNSLESKTETVINQVATRLKYRIKPTMIARSTATADYLSINSPDLNSTTITYDMVEWIGYDYDSFLGDHNGTFSVPGWSGFIDLDNGATSNAAGTLRTPGSDLNITDRVIKALSSNHVGFSAPAVQNPAVIFKCQQDTSNLNLYGWDGSANLADHNYTLAVTQSDSQTFQIDAAQQDANRSICEQYYLAWSAYGLVPEGTDDNDFNLTLKYNYQPWYGDKYSDANTSSVVLAEHVSTFRVMQVGETLRIKICIQDGNITGEPVGFCKEKAIF
jgi:prepilin-type N-terminal cleavage/methylation domain-containing protein